MGTQTERKTCWHLELKGRGRGRERGGARRRSSSSSRKEGDKDEREDRTSDKTVSVEKGTFFFLITEEKKLEYSTRRKVHEAVGLKFGRLVLLEAPYLARINMHFLGSED